MLYNLTLNVCFYRWAFVVVCLHNVHFLNTSMNKNGICDVHSVPAGAEQF